MLQSGMATRFQFPIRNVFWAMTLLFLTCLVPQFAVVGVPYWWKWGDGEATEVSGKN
jgi:hypothetical protein